MNILTILGSRIDMAAHDNDAAAHAYEALTYHDTIELVKKYIDAHPGTVMISVSDHETGGLTLSRQLSSDYPEYKWNPEVVARVRNSTEVLASAILAAPLSDRAEYVRNVVLALQLGVEDFTEEDVAYLSNGSRNSYQVMWYLGELVNRRALLGWATHGHTGVCL
jgi:alkaline phosphatase